MIMTTTLRIKDVSEYVGIKLRTLHKMLEDNRFPVEPLPNIKPRRWAKADIDAWLSSNRGNVAAEK